MTESEGRARAHPLYSFKSKEPAFSRIEALEKSVCPLKAPVPWLIRWAPVSSPEFKLSVPPGGHGDRTCPSGCRRPSTIDGGRIRRGLGAAVHSPLSSLPAFCHLVIFRPCWISSVHLRWTTTFQRRGVFVSGKTSWSAVHAAARDQVRSPSHRHGGRCHPIEWIGLCRCLTGTAHHHQPGISHRDCRSTLYLHGYYNWRATPSNHFVRCTTTNLYVY